MAATTKKPSPDMKYPQSFDVIRNYIKEIFDTHEAKLKKLCERDYKIGWNMTADGEDFTEIRVPKEPTVFIPTEGCIDTILNAVTFEALRKLSTINDWTSVYSLLHASLHSEILLSVCQQYSQHHLHKRMTVLDVSLQIRKISRKHFNLPGTTTIDASGRERLMKYKKRFGPIFASEDLIFDKSIDWPNMIKSAGKQ